MGSNDTKQVHLAGGAIRIGMAIYCMAALMMLPVLPILIPIHIIGIFQGIGVKASSCDVSVNGR